MNCREREEAIALYAGGDLAEPLRREVERHLAGCPGCQIFASGMMECLEGLHAAHHQEQIDPAHFATVRARVLARLQPRRWCRRKLVWMAAACAGLWLALAVPPLGRPDLPPPQVALAHPPAPPLPAPERPPARHRLARLPARPAEPLIVRIVTDNPDVVIYWLATIKGE